MLVDVVPVDEPDAGEGLQQGLGQQLDQLLGPAAHGDALEPVRWPPATPAAPLDHALYATNSGSPRIEALISPAGTFSSL